MNLISLAGELGAYDFLCMIAFTQYDMTLNGLLCANVPFTNYSVKRALTVLVSVDYWKGEQS